MRVYKLVDFRGAPRMVEVTCDVCGETFECEKFWADCGSNMCQDCLETHAESLEFLRQGGII